MAKTMRKHNKKSRRPRRQNGRKTRRMRTRRGGVPLLDRLFGKTPQSSAAVSQPTTPRVEPNYDEEKAEIIEFLKKTKKATPFERYILIDQIVNKLKKTSEFDKYQELLKTKIDGFI